MKAALKHLFVKTVAFLIYFGFDLLINCIVVCTNLLGSRQVYSFSVAVPMKRPNPVVVSVPFTCLSYCVGSEKNVSPKA